MSFTKWASAVWAIIGNNPEVRRALAQGGGCPATASAEQCLAVAYGDAPRDAHSEGATPKQAARQALTGMWA